LRLQEDVAAKRLFLRSLPVEINADFDIRKGETGVFGGGHKNSRRGRFHFGRNQ
jgi:hypothetical protein